jgi:hypothetical protein
MFSFTNRVLAIYKNSAQLETENDGTKDMIQGVNCVLCQRLTPEGALDGL